MNWWSRIRAAPDEDLTPTPAPTPSPTDETSTPVPTLKPTDPAGSDDDETTLDQMRDAARAGNDRNFPRPRDRSPEPPSSSYYGVSKHTGVAKHIILWRAQITRGEPVYLGYFDDEQEAARAVDEYLASIGEERRNFPEDEVGDLGDLGGDAFSSPQ